NSIVPEYLIVHSPQDMRTPRALADLEQMAQRISQLPGVAKISGITRPTGKPIEEAMATYQAGEVGKRLDDGANLITGHSGDLNKLANGAHTLADSLGDVRGQVGSAINSVRGLVDALGYVQGMIGGNKTLNQLGNAAKLVNGMRELGDAIIANLDNVSESFSWT